MRWVLGHTLKTGDVVMLTGGFKSCEMLQGVVIAHHRSDAHLSIAMPARPSTQEYILMHVDSVYQILTEPAGTQPGDTDMKSEARVEPESAQADDTELPCTTRRSKRKVTQVTYARTCTHTHAIHTRYTRIRTCTCIYIYIYLQGSIG
jgi:hypothetical protein